jgi:hypothetical protein
MTTPTKTNPADDGFYACNLGDKLHVAAMSPVSEKTCSDGGINHVKEGDASKSGMTGIVQRRGLDNGRGLTFVAIILVCLVIGMLGFFTTGKSIQASRIPGFPRVTDSVCFV